MAPYYNRFMHACDVHYKCTQTEPYKSSHEKLAKFLQQNVSSCISQYPNGGPVMMKCMSVGNGNQLGKMFPGTLSCDASFVTEQKYARALSHESGIISQQIVAKLKKKGY